MKARQRFFSVPFAVALLAAATLGGGSASAAPGAITCTVNATLMLPAPENILYVNGGSGTVAATYVCEGGTTAGVSLAGVGSGSGDFRFCNHPSHAYQCVDSTKGWTYAPSPDATGEALADQAASKGIPVGHTMSDLISFTLNTGVTCTHGLNGHNFLTFAHIVATNLTCKSSGGVTVFGPVHSTINDRNAEIVVNPLLDCAPHPATGAKACFQQLLYQGQLVARSTS